MMPSDGKIMSFAFYLQSKQQVDFLEKLCLAPFPGIIPFDAGILVESNSEPMCGKYAQ